MGALSLFEFFVASLVWHFAAACFLGFVLWFVLDTASTVWSTSNADNDVVLCACIFRRFSTAQFTVGCTATSVAFWFLSTVGAVVEAILYFGLSPNCKKFDDLPAAVTSVDFFIADCFRSVGYLLMFVTHFERLRLTFSGTMMRLPQWSPYALYGVLLVAALMLATMQAFHNSNVIVTAILLFLLFSWYILSVSALIRAFYKRTMALAQNDTEIVETAVRVSLSVALSLVTSVCTLLLVVSYMLWPRSLHWLLIRRSVEAADTCLNAFCLLCTFARAKGHYMRAFGRLHAIFMAQVSSQRSLQLTERRMKMQTASPTASQLSASFDK